MKLLEGRKKIFLALILFIGLFLVFTQAKALDVGLNQAAEIGLGTADLRVTIASLIRVAFGLLGIVAVVLVIIGGVMYLTSAGEAEKIAKAKKLLIGAVIGLVIMLSAFAIASFVINALVEPGEGPPIIISDCTDPSCFPCTNCDPPGSCPDPTESYKAPYICSLSPTHGAKGDYVTILGGKFGNTKGSSEVVFKKGETEWPAAIVYCGADMVWHMTEIKVEVPAELQFDALISNNNIYKVVVRTTDGSSEAAKKQTDPLNPNDLFTFEDGLPGPGIACIDPERGPENTPITVRGKRFGTTRGVNDNLKFPLSNTATINANILSWADETITSTVPQGAISRPVSLVYVTKDTDRSNGSPFYVTCNNANLCSAGNCCSGGYCAGGTSDYCLYEEGQSCDTNETPGCQAGNCVTNTYCDISTCTCKSAGVGTDCNYNIGAPTCTPNNNKCGNGLYCSTVESCTCQYLPRIDDFQPRSGDKGTFVTILGRGFGKYYDPISKKYGGVSFSNGSGGYIAASYPLCATSKMWKDNQIIVKVPDGAATGPIKITTTESLSDATNDTNGLQADFTRNSVAAGPGICSADPEAGEFGSLVDIEGENFGISKAYTSVKLGGTDFDGNWTLTSKEIIDLKVPNITPATLPIVVHTPGQYSNPYYFTVLPSTKVPTIDYIDPTQGPTSQYVTIFGSNFGSLSSTSAVLFLPTNGDVNKDNWAQADTNFPASCTQQGYWHDQYIVVKVPSGAILGAGKLAVRTIIDAANNYIYSNEVAFNHCVVGSNCPLRPGICAISPDQGPVGTKGVTLYGEGFGDYLAPNSQVVFWDNKAVTDLNLNYWNFQNSNKVGSGILGTPPMTVPTGAVSGPVVLKDKNGIVSNKIQFTVGDCRQNANLCAGTTSCCDQRDGICKTTADCAIQYPAMCTYSWAFKTSLYPPALPVPQVIESIDCIDKTQSPTPWKKSVDNCTNIWISARFNQLMDIATLNQNNIIVKSCDNSLEFDVTKCTTVLTPASLTTFDHTLPAGNLATGFQLAPAGKLIKNTWYQVTLKSGTTGIKSPSPQSKQLDGDFNGQPGGDYVWYFKTRDSDLACDVDKVVVSPQESVLKKLDQKQIYNAFALAANCNILDGNGYDWNWYKVYSDIYAKESAQCNNPADDPVPQTKYCLAKISEDDVLPPPKNNNIDYLQTATPQKQGLTFVGAEVFKDDAVKNRKDDNNKLIIDLNIPEIDYFTPTNGLVRPEVKTNVTIYGRNFGKVQGASQALFGDVIAPLADCKEAWSDTMIKIQVPQGQPILADTKATYALPAPGKEDGMTLFYDFEDTSNVIVKDRINGFDGEIKGAPTHISDQFKQAMQLNGTADYIKLPNVLSQTTGSLEFWFLPQGNGTLFSATDGTATNAFSLDYNSANNTRGIIKDNNWNYLAYTYNGSQAALYLNGFKFTTFTDTGISLAGSFIGANKTNILIGAKNITNLSNYFKGEIDNFSIYSTILTQDNIFQHFGLSQGQVLFLKFEEAGTSISDSSANNFNGLEIMDKTKSFRNNVGVSGQAVKFNKDNSIRINNDPSLIFNKGIAIEGWFKVDTLSNGTIFQADNVVIQINGSQQLNFGARIEDANTGQQNNYFANINLADTDKNKWNYFAGVFDGQKIAIYLNDQKHEFLLPGDSTGSIYQDLNLNRACLGGQTNLSGSCTSNFTGSLDELAIYNRALTEAEINSR
ncbi:MAG: IPT/TIG domain-containing protein, partial [Candidatus Parcubacteria bacterium]|nr:IPT/TIG domain-containing protein [Candidatus Parcubacteria bacterium]